MSTNSYCRACCQHSYNKAMQLAHSVWSTGLEYLGTRTVILRTVMGCSRGPVLLPQRFGRLIRSALCATIAASHACSCHAAVAVTAIRLMDMLYHTMIFYWAQLILAQPVGSPLRHLRYGIPRWVPQCVTRLLCQFYRT